MGLFNNIYPKNDLNVYDVISINLKIILSTNSSTRIIKTLILKKLEKIYIDEYNESILKYIFFLIYVKVECFKKF